MRLKSENYEKVPFTFLAGKERANLEMKRRGPFSLSTSLEETRSTEEEEGTEIEEERERGWGRRRNPLALIVLYKSEICEGLCKAKDKIAAF